MLKVLVLSCFIVAVRCQFRFLSDDPQSVPTPYQYGYNVLGHGGSHSKSETGDGNGRVQGSYEINEDDGRSRLVQYIADEDGFRASVSTNEPGTANQNPADVNFRSSAEDTGDRFSSPANEPRPISVTLVRIPETGFTPIDVTPAEPRFRPIVRSEAEPRFRPIVRSEAEPRVTPIAFVIPGRQQSFSSPPPPPPAVSPPPPRGGNQGLALFLVQPMGPQRLDFGNFRSQLGETQLRSSDNIIPLAGISRSQILSLLRQ